MKVLNNAVTIDEERRSSARVPLEGHRGPLARLLTWYSRRTYGDVLDVGLAMLHNRRVLLTYLRFEAGVGRWRGMDDNLKTLAVMAAAAEIGCSWCMDFGYYEAHTRGMDTAKLKELPRWRTSAAFGDVERRVIEYAEAASRTPMEVSDEMVQRLRADLGNKAVVELTMMIALENSRSRFNSALGLRSQGFRERCELAG
jgi:AhpD family alkylhydroperoxidase